MSKVVITEEISEKIFQMKEKDGKSLDAISKTLHLKPLTVKNHYYKTRYVRPEKETLFDKRNCCSAENIHSGKFVWLTSTLIKHKKHFDALLILGYQNCRELTELMKSMGKIVIAVDWDKKSFNGNEEIQPVLADCLQPQFKYFLAGIKAYFPKCASYVNLTGRRDLIENVHKCKFSPIIAVTSPRSGRGNKHCSSLKRCKELGAKIHHLEKTNMKIAIFE